jgi:hypothetical protein
MLDVESGMASQKFSQGVPLMGEELSRRRITGRRRCRNNSRRNMQTSSCPILSM